MSSRLLARPKWNHIDDDDDRHREREIERQREREGISGENKSNSRTRIGPKTCNSCVICSADATALVPTTKNQTRVTYLPTARRRRSGGPPVLKCEWIYGLKRQSQNSSPLFASCDTDDDKKKGGGVVKFDENVKYIEGKTAPSLFAHR